MSPYFVFEDDPIDYDEGDFDFVNTLFQYDGEAEPPPDAVYFNFIGTAGPLTPTPEGIVLSFRDPKALNPYNARSIDGLDGIFKPKYYSSESGQKFYTLEKEPVEVIFKIGLNPDFSANETFSDLRAGVYKVTSISKTGRVDIHFMNDDEIVAVLTGFVTKVESNPSDRDQMMAVTVYCEDPVLRSPSPIVINYDLLDFSDFTISDDISTAPHGVSFRIKINEAIPDLIITDPTDASWNFRVIPIGGFDAGEVLHFSSEFGRKEIRTTARNLMDRVTGKSIWPIIFPGSNRLSFNNSDSLSWQSLSYYRAYWGV